MSKKNRQKLQKLLKHQRLQQLRSAGQIVSSAASPVGLPPTLSETSRDLPTRQPLAEASTEANPHFAAEIYRTLSAIGIIAVLIMAVFLFDQRTNRLIDFGDQLYRALRLNH